MLGPKKFWVQKIFNWAWDWHNSWGPYVVNFKYMYVQSLCYWQYVIGENLCTNTRGCVINVHARWKTCKHTFTTCVRFLSDLLPSSVPIPVGFSRTEYTLNPDYFYWVWPSSVPFSSLFYCIFWDSVFTRYTSSHYCQALIYILSQSLTC